MQGEVRGALVGASTPHRTVAVRSHFGSEQEPEKLSASPDSHGDDGSCNGTVLKAARSAYVVVVLDTTFAAQF